MMSFGRFYIRLILEQLHGRVNKNNWKTVEGKTCQNIKN